MEVKTGEGSIHLVTLIGIWSISALNALPGIGSFYCFSYLGSTGPQIFSSCYGAGIFKRPDFVYPLLLINFRSYFFRVH